MVRLLDRGLALTRVAFMGLILQHQRRHFLLFVCRFLEVLTTLFRSSFCSLHFMLR
jgi:hypothetical protein